MDQPSLFDAPYPKSPGYKRPGTSKRAAEAMKPHAPTIRDEVLRLIRGCPMTADECAMRLNKSVLAVRPRLSELVALHLITDTGRTHKNASGVAATVWEAI